MSDKFWAFASEVTGRVWFVERPGVGTNNPVDLPVDDSPSLWELELLAEAVLAASFPDAFEDYAGWADAHRNLDEAAHAPVMVTVPEWTDYDPAGDLISAWKFETLQAIWFPTDFAETVADAKRVGHA